jgi:hypothetical protein
MKKRTKFIFIILVVICCFALFLYGYSQKSEHIDTLVGDECLPAIQYYRGLGLLGSNNWLGRIRSRIVIPQDHSEILFCRGVVSGDRKFYPSGQLESQSPIVETFMCHYIIDGTYKFYNENGKVRLLLSARPRRPGDNVDCDQVSHGIYRDFDENGRTYRDLYFLDGKECSKKQWLEHLKKHPEDVKYYIEH